mmetsp:Transcript_36586/g.105203  ORF Transcript_36586/g.105203 Transcript_36586/m.105203 type:complete len:223 (-) Transcript_36586:312-980(-)
MERERTRAPTRPAGTMERMGIGGTRKLETTSGLTIRRTSGTRRSTSRCARGRCRRRVSAEPRRSGPVTEGPGHRPAPRSRRLRTRPCTRPRQAARRAAPALARAARADWSSRMAQSTRGSFKATSSTVSGSTSSATGRSTRANGKTACRRGRVRNGWRTARTSSATSRGGTKTATASSRGRRVAATRATSIRTTCTARAPTSGATAAPMSASGSATPWGLGA